MPRADFFSIFHFFVLHDVFDAGLCAQLRSEARAATRAPATVYGGADYVVDSNVRRTQWVEVSPSSLSLVENRLLHLLPRVQNHFQLPLSGCDGTQFLAYRPGDFYLPHRDVRNPQSGSSRKQRQISIVIFLSNESEEPQPESYGGGALTFYGLMGAGQGARVGLPLSGEAGLLVAFPSSVLHEVTPVTHGERYTIVSWFV